MWSRILPKWLQQRGRETKLALRPDVPCFNKAEHYYWVDQKWPCPACCLGEVEKEAKEREPLDQLRAAIESLQADIQELADELRRRNLK